MLQLIGIFYRDACRIIKLEKAEVKEERRGNEERGGKRDRTLEENSRGNEIKYKYKQAELL